MATTSKRSMSQTLRPLSEMWDANGRIRPPQVEEPQETATPEESVKAEGVRMTAAKQKEVVADDKLNSDIETFIKNPEQFEGAEVRRADFGVREFSFGGQRAFTYNASAELAERKALAKLDDRKTFAELLTVDMPGKLEVAKELWTRAGDRDGASAEIGAIDGFVKDNYDTLVTLTKYNGHDDLATKIAVKARDMISGAYKTDFLTMDRDPEIRAKVAGKQALDMGLSGDAADTYARATAARDPNAMALWAAAGAPASLVAQPGISGTGQSPQSARAAATSMNTEVVSKFLEYAPVAEARLTAGLGVDTVAAMSPGERAKLLRTSFDAGDEVAGGAVLGVVVSAAGTVDGLDARGRINVADSTLRTVQAARAAWGRQDDPMWSSLGVKTVAAMQPLLPGTRLAEHGAAVSGVLSEVSKTVAGSSSFGIAMSAPGVAKLARVRLASSLNMAQNLESEERKLKSDMDSLNSLFAGIRTDPDWRVPKGLQANISDKEGAPAAEPLGYKMQKAAIGVVFELAVVDMAETGVDRKTALDRNIKPLSDTLAAQGAASQELAEATAKFTLRHLTENGGGDLASVARDVRAKRGELAGMERAGLDKPVDAGAGLPRVAAAKARAVTSGPIDSKVYEVLSSSEPGRNDLKPGEGEWNSLRKRTDSALAPLVDSLVSPGSSMYGILADAKMSELDSPDTIARAASAFVEQAKAGAPKTVALLGDDALMAFGSEIVTKVARGMLGTAGVRPGATGLAAMLSRPLPDVIKDTTFRESFGSVDVFGQEVPGAVAQYTTDEGSADLVRMSPKRYANTVFKEVLAASVLSRAVGGVTIAPSFARLLPGAVTGGLAGAAIAGIEAGVGATAKALSASSEVALGHSFDQAFSPVWRAAAEFGPPLPEALTTVTRAVGKVGGRQVAGAVLGNVANIAGAGALAYAMGLDRVQPTSGSDIAVKARHFANAVFMGPETPADGTAVNATETSPALDTGAYGPGAVLPARKEAGVSAYGDLFLDPKFKIEDVMATLDTVLHKSRASAEFTMENEMVFKTVPDRLGHENQSKVIDLQNEYFNDKNAGKIKSFEDARQFFSTKVAAVEKGIEKKRLEFLAKQLAERAKAKGSDDIIRAPTDLDGRE